MDPYKSLVALSVGDAYGENMLRILPPQYQNYCWTDDTAMALSVFQCLREKNTIDQDRLMTLFSESYAKDPHRGYGRSTATLCKTYVYDKDWALNSKAAFNGHGSYGNGAAMRVAPLGVWFESDLNRVVIEARKQSEVTHFNDEAIAGAIAVALAAARPTVCDYWDTILRYTPASSVRERIENIRFYGSEEFPIKDSKFTHMEIASFVGNGDRVTAEDTVPYALWCAFQGIQNQDFVATIQKAATVKGDTDTYCAMIGGILGNLAPPPIDWIQKTERLPF